MFTGGYDSWELCWIRWRIFRSLIQLFFVDEENTAKENSMVEQKHFSPVMILASIIFMSTFVPLSIDLYLPALPQMREYFQASEMLVNMTLIAFFLFFP